MARKLRIQYEGAIYHLMSRGDHREPIFHAAMDTWEQARRARRRFGTFCDSNGSFRLPDIPAGTYELEIKVLDSTGDSVSPRQPYEAAPEIGSILREVVAKDFNTIREVVETCVEKELREVDLVLHFNGNFVEIAIRIR